MWMHCTCIIDYIFTAFCTTCAQIIIIAKTCYSDTNLRHLPTNIFEINSSLKRKTKIADPCHIDTNPDPPIRVSD
jgi:hypothetical protein